ncbi:MAG: hypothetical protein AAGA80_25550 [Cyanobacteria bacterium P01_F01_bin.143]
MSRIIYFSLDLNRNPKPRRNLNLYVSQNLPLVENLNLSLDLYLYLCLNQNQNIKLNLKLAEECNSQLHEVLLKLKERFPDEENTKEIEIQEWWQENGLAWAKEFRNAMTKYQNIGHDWQFSEEQKTLLEKYYRANQLLTQCLHHECYVSLEVRQEIEETLLLPIEEIKKRSSSVQSAEKLSLTQWRL